MKKVLGLVMLFSLILFLVACGGDDTTAEPSDTKSDTEQTEENNTSNATTNIDMTATNFKFTQSEYTVSKGDKVTITLTNEEGMHGIGINEFDVNIQGNGEATFTADKPGEYTMYCNVPCGAGHADMKATLIVTDS